jgi:hypothetical protein
MGQAHLGHQTLEASAARHTVGRLASILINPSHLRLGPAQSQRALDEAVWQARRLLMPEHLLRSRLAHIDRCQTIVMRPVNFVVCHRA